MTTKAEELKALEKIEKIVAELGENSYLSMAFEGCFEDARENIANDFGCSWKQRAESTEKKLEAAEQQNKELQARIEQLERKNKKLEEKTLDVDDLRIARGIVNHNVVKQREAMNQAADKIVELAEHTNTNEFADAVCQHRAYKRAYEESTALHKRICEILG